VKVDETFYQCLCGWFVMTAASFRSNNLRTSSGTIIGLPRAFRPSLPGRYDVVLPKPRGFCSVGQSPSSSTSAFSCNTTYTAANLAAGLVGPKYYESSSLSRRTRTHRFAASSFWRTTTAAAKKQ
jgi:hypothetical protein